MHKTEKVDRLLKIAKGQIDGILKMLDENQDCVNISSQLAATTSILKKVNIEILSNHLTHCVKETFETSDETAKQAKINEVTDLLNAIMK